MKTFFVYYQDDYCENGGHGIKSFKHKKDASNFVIGRMQEAENFSIKDYIVIEGEKLEIEVIEKVKDIELNCKKGGNLDS